MEQASLQIILHLPIFGAQQSGKSSLRKASLGQPFDEKYLPTIGVEINVFQFNIYGLNIKYVIYDTNGSNEQRKLFNIFQYINQFELDKSQNMSILSFVGALIVFSRTDPQSINIIDELYWYAASKNKIKTSLISVFGNKNDLPLAQNVNIEQLQKYCQTKQILFCQGSSKTHQNIKKFYQKFSLKLFEICRINGMIKIIPRQQISQQSISSQKDIKSNKK